MKISIDKCPYEDGDKLYDKDSFELREGVTVLCGCNGSGKTTLMKQIESEVVDLRSDDILDDKFSIISFYDDGLDGRDFRQRLFDSGDMQSTFRDAFSSEGEKRFDRLGHVISTIGHCIRHKGCKEILVLIDGLDSGVSIDLSIEMVDGLTWLQDQIKEDGCKLYFYMTANNFEFVKAFYNIDVKTFDEISFDNYEDYSKYILKTKEYKDKRLEEYNKKLEEEEDDRYLNDFERKIFEDEEE